MNKIDNTTLKIFTKISWQERWKAIRSPKVFEAITTRIQGLRGVLRQENHCLVFYVNDVNHTINVHARFCGVSFEVQKLEEFIPQNKREQEDFDYTINDERDLIRLIAMDSADYLFCLNIIVEELLNA